MLTHREFVERLIDVRYVVHRFDLRSQLRMPDEDHDLVRFRMIQEQWTVRGDDYLPLAAVHSAGADLSKLLENERQARRVDAVLWFLDQQDVGGIAVQQGEK